MSRADLPSSRAAAEAAKAPIDLDTLVVRLNRDIKRVFMHTPNLAWVGLCCELEPAEPDMVTFVETRTLLQGELSLSADIPFSELQAGSFPIAFWLADTFDYAASVELDRLNEQAYDLLTYTRRQP